MCHILGCLCGVWEVSGGCLNDSEYCLGEGGYDVKWIDKHQIWISLISCGICSQWPFVGNFWLKTSGQMGRENMDKKNGL